jgi:hypothetical protein
MTMYAPSSRFFTGQSNCHATPVVPLRVTAPVWRVPSRSQETVAGTDEVVRSTVTFVTSVVTTNGAVKPRGAIVRTAGPLALPGLLRRPVWRTLEVRPSRDHSTLTVTRL